MNGGMVLDKTKVVAGNGASQVRGRVFKSGCWAAEIVAKRVSGRVLNRH